MGHSEKVVTRGAVEQSAWRQLLVLSEVYILQSETSELFDWSRVDKVLMVSAFISAFEIVCMAIG